MLHLKNKDSKYWYKIHYVSGFLHCATAIRQNSHIRMFAHAIYIFLTKLTY